MFVVYILRSLSKGQMYVGHTQDIEIRMQRHNAGKERYTKSGTPWELIYTEEYISRGEAMKREKYLKNLKNPKYILENIVGKVNFGM